MSPSRPELHDLTVTICSSLVVRLQRVFLMEKTRLALLVGARFRKTFHQSQNKNVCVWGISTAGELPGQPGAPKDRPGSRRPPAGTEAMIMMAVHELFLLGFLSIYPEGEGKKNNKKWLHIFARDLSL